MSRFRTGSKPSGLGRSGERADNAAFPAIKICCFISRKNAFCLDTSVVGIYKRKQECKKTRKHAFGQESDKEKKKENTLSIKKAIKKKNEKKDNGQEKRKENTLSTKKVIKKKKPFLDCFFGRFLSRERVFYLIFSYYLVFFNKFSPQSIYFY